MPLDPRLILQAGQGVTPVDPQAFQRGMASAYQLQAAQQTNQANALQLEGAQRQEQERGTLARAFRGAVTTDPTTGRATLDVPQAFSAAYQTSTNPLAVLKAETEYGKGQAESRKATLEARKAQMQQQQEQLAFVGQVANGVLAAVDMGDDPQQAYERGIAAVQQAGLPIQGLPPTFDRGVVTQFAATSQKYQEALQNQQKVIDQQLRAREIGVAERKEQREEARPDYGYGQELNAGLYARYGDQLGPRGRPTPAMVQQVRQDLREEKTATAERTGFAGATAKPLEGPALQRVNMLMQGEDVVKALQTEFTPEERAQYVGLGGLRMNAQQAQQLLADAGQGKADPKFARFAALVALGKQEAFSTAGQALSGHERDVVFGYIPTGKEWSAQEFEQKLQLSQERLPTLIDRELTLSTTPRSELLEKRRRGELPSMMPGRPAAAEAGAAGAGATPQASPRVTPLGRSPGQAGASSGASSGGGKGAPVTADEIGRMMERAKAAGTPLTAQEVIQRLRTQGFTIEGLD